MNTHPNIINYYFRLLYNLCNVIYATQVPNCRLILGHGALAVTNAEHNFLRQTADVKRLKVLLPNGAWLIEVSINVMSNKCPSLAGVRFYHVMASFLL